MGKTLTIAVCNACATTTASREHLHNNDNIYYYGTRLIILNNNIIRCVVLSLCKCPAVRTRKNNRVRDKLIIIKKKKNR